MQFCIHVWSHWSLPGWKIPTYPTLSEGVLKGTSCRLPWHGFQVPQAKTPPQNHPTKNIPESSHGKSNSPKSPKQLQPAWTELAVWTPFFRPGNAGRRDQRFGPHHGAIKILFQVFLYEQRMLFLIMGKRSNEWRYLCYLLSLPKIILQHVWNIFQNTTTSITGSKNGFSIFSRKFLGGLDITKITHLLLNWPWLARTSTTHATSVHSLKNQWMWGSQERSMIQWFSECWSRQTSNGLTVLESDPIDRLILEVPPSHWNLGE